MFYSHHFADQQLLDDMAAAPTAVDYMEGGSILDDMKPAAKLETNVQTVKKSGANQEEGGGC